MAGSVYGDVSFTVTPEELRTQSQEVSRRVANLEKLFDELRQAMRGTKSYWTGEAADLYRNRYESGQKNLDDMFRRLRNHPVQLMKMAGVYTTADENVSELVKGLKTSVIN